MEDLTEPNDSKGFKRTQDTVRSADSGIDTIATTSTPFPSETGMGDVIQELQKNHEKRVSEESGDVKADEISKLTKLNDKQKTREIDVNNRIKEYRTVS